MKPHSLWSKIQDASKPTGISIGEIRTRTLLVGLGAMKSGTSWLSKYLTNHPDFFHSPIKEINFFNNLYPNPFRGEGEEYRRWRMDQIILEHPDILTTAAYKRLYALAQFGQLQNTEDYLTYFAQRMNQETHFGEISPSYSHIRYEDLCEIATLTRDVRFVFLMRDPTSRAVSHIQHVRRRIRADESIDSIIGTIDERSPIYLRSSYGTTLDATKRLGERAHVMTYETLFKESTIEQLCDWLGLCYFRPDFERRVNAARGEELSVDQKQRIRDRLSPIYRDLAERFGPERPAMWHWSGIG